MADRKLHAMNDADRDPRTQPAPIDPMAYYFQDVLLLNQPHAVRLYLIRHGQSGGNVARQEGRLAEYDPPLTPVGERSSTLPAVPPHISAPVPAVESIPPTC